MNTKSRIASIVTADCLNTSITGIPSFDLSELILPTDLDFELPTNLRLGHLAEKVVSELIKSSSNYKVLHENVQLIADKQTIGEIDFLVEHIETKRTIHMELAYKFYLYDPTISSEQINNWIGPNRNDSLIQKLEKLKNKQFPLLHHELAKSTFDELDINEVSQQLCLLISLYIPYEFKESLNPVYEKAVKGYYVSLKTLISLDDSEKTYYLPPKKQWGMDPPENENWVSLTKVEEYINICMNEKQAPLVWQKQEDKYIEFFIVWW